MQRKSKAKKSSKKSFSSVEVVKSKYGKPLKNQISSLNGDLIGFPDRLRVQLKWSEQYSNTGAPLKGNVFRGNSIFDPDFTGIFSTTPAYYTALKAVYGQYVVLGSRIEAQFNNEASVSAQGLLWCSDVNLGSNTFQQNAESKRSKVIQLGPLTGQGKGLLKMEASSEEIQGQQHLESDPSNYASMSNNPSDTWYYGYQVQSWDASNVNCNITITMVFDLVLKELVSFAT
jgi:hypothetical protein